MENYHITHSLKPRLVGENLKNNYEVYNVEWYKMANNKQKNIYLIKSEYRQCCIRISVQRRKEDDEKCLY